VRITDGGRRAEAYGMLDAESKGEIVGGAARKELIKEPKSLLAKG